jgi:hypothetical protein
MSICRERSPEELANYVKELEEISDILNKLSIPWVLTCGTLLGIYRDGKIISWDEDIDIDIRDEFFERKDKIKEEFEKNGFTVIIGEPNNIECVKYDHPCNIRFWKLVGDKREKRAGYGVSTLPVKFLDETSTITFNGKEYPCPKDIEEYFEHVYGESWRTPYKVQQDFKECYTKKYCDQGRLN